MTKIILQETLRTIFYAPLYSAFSLGAFAREGLDVELRTSPRPADAAAGLIDGSLDVSLGGPMRVMKLREENPPVRLTCFCEVVTRDPFCLVGHTPRPNFTFTDLFGLTIASVSEVTAPWLCLRTDMIEAGYEPDRLQRIVGRTMSENAEALRRGKIDVAQLLSPLVDELLAEGKGHIWYAGSSRGPLALTCFFARETRLLERYEEFCLLTRAMYRTQQWLEQASFAEVAKLIAHFFPETVSSMLEAAIARYQQQGIWSHTPHLNKVGYDRLMTSLVSGGFLSEGTPYEDAVDESLADWAVTNGAVP